MFCFDRVLSTVNLDFGFGVLENCTSAEELECGRLLGLRLRCVFVRPCFVHFVCPPTIFAVHKQNVISNLFRFFGSRPHCRAHAGVFTRLHHKYIGTLSSSRFHTSIIWGSPLQQQPSLIAMDHVRFLVHTTTVVHRAHQFFYDAGPALLALLLVVRAPPPPAPLRVLSVLLGCGTGASSNGVVVTSVPCR